MGHCLLSILNHGEIMEIDETKSKKAADEKFCPDCGEIIKARAEICPKCGIRQMAPPSSMNIAPNGKSKVAAALLAFFLGGFGVHKFYLGQIGQGIIYLLFFWTFIPAIIAFIEFIILITMGDETFNARFGSA